MFLRKWENGSYGKAYSFWIFLPKCSRIICSCMGMEDDFTHQKYSTGYICRELLEADEANLLDVEDMHVYGEKPMTDPLQLVCCNVCKKPIKDSQYASHAELCRSLTLTEPASLKHNGSTRKQKSARKEKKKLSTSCATTAVGKRRRAESMDNIDTAVSQSNLNGQIRATSFSIEAKGEDLLEGTALEHGSPDHKSIGLVHEQHVTSNDFPAPLATKIYYQQRSNRFRAAIRHLYFQDSSEDTGT